MSGQRIARIGAAIILASVAVVVALGLAWYAPWKPVLVVWSCGGNYEILTEYAGWFEREHNCRVRYTAAPVQYLLELAAIFLEVIYSLGNLLHLDVSILIFMNLFH